MVGNDIIDIEETRRSTNWTRPRFMQKLFTVHEQAIINTATDPFTMVWQLWSMKESAYKVFIQAGGHRFFNPTKIQCSLENSKTGQVEINTSKLKTSLKSKIKTNTSFNANYIFSTAIINKEDVDTHIFQVAEKSGINDSKHQSNFIYQQIINYFSTMHSLNTKALSIRKTEMGIPKLYYKSKVLNTSISITHHGKYAAYSIQKNTFNKA